MYSLEELDKMNGQNLPNTPTTTPVATTPKVSTPIVNPSNNVDADETDNGQFFTGSGLQKFFDVLSLPQYASAGLAKSLVKKTNIFKGIGEGVKNRTSYSNVLDQAGVKNKYVKAIGGFAGDILLDPTTYIGAGAVKAGLKKIPKVGKLIGKADDFMDVANLTQKFPALKKYGGLISNKLRTGGNIEYLDDLGRMRQGVSNVVENATELGKNITKSPIDFTYGKYVIKKGQEFPEALQKRITQLLEGAGTGGPGGITMNEVLASLTDPIKEGLQKAGQELVRTKQAGKEVFEKYKGGYLPSYLKEKVESTKGLTGNKLTTDRFKKRGVSTAWEEFVQQPGYRAARGLTEEGKNVEVGKFFETINKKWAKDTAEEGFKQIPKTQAYGKLAGKYVPDYIAKDIMGAGGVRPGDFGLGIDKLFKGYDKALSVWKAGKTVLSPSQQVRNTVSNQILNYMVGGAGAVSKLPKAVKEYAKKGDLYQQAKKAGVFSSGFSANEIQKLLPSQSADGVLKKSLEKIKSGWNKAIDVAGGIQNKNEEIAKLQQFIYQRGKGKTADEAKKLAEKALFNYGDLTPFEKNVLKRIIPFYTFTRKAIPLTVETAIKNPNRISLFNKAQTAVNNLTPERSKERSILPSYLKNAVRVPGTKSKYLATDYLYPWAGFLGESDLPLGMNIPGWDLADKVVRGYDPYYKQPVSDSPLPKDQIKARAKAAASTLLPSAVQKTLLPSSQKTLGQSLLGQTGLNVYDLNPSSATKSQQYALNELQSSISSQMKKASKIENKDSRNRRIKELQDYLVKRRKEILTGE